MKITKAICLSAVPLLIAAQAQADDYKVYKPQVVKGEFAAEANLNYDFDHRDALDKYFSQVLGFEYGLTDYWQTELSGEFEKENGDSDKLTHIKWENVFVPFKHGEYWMDAGLYLEFEKAIHNDEPNNMEAKILLEKNLGKFDNTLNLIASHEVGPNHETGFDTGIAWQTRYRYSKEFEPGVEYYADFGNSNDSPAFKDQEHKVGPVIAGKVGNLNYDTGVLFGISQGASDTTVKFNLEYEF